MNADEQTSIFDDLNKEKPVRRKDMIPKWIRVFCWIFAIVGAFAMLLTIAAFIFPASFNISIYGFSVSQMGYIIWLVLGVYLLKLLTAIGLLTEKDWAVKLAIADGIIGIVLCIVSTFYFWSTNFQWRLEIFVLTPYLVIMRSIRKDWEANRFAILQITNRTE